MVNSGIPGRLALGRHSPLLTAFDFYPNIEKQLTFSAGARMIPSLLSDEFQAAFQLANDDSADPKHRQIATGAVMRMQYQDIEVPGDATLEWRRGYIDPSLPLRISR
jgi:hypothetical protein